jgi:hypothetical protein
MIGFNNTFFLLNDGIPANSIPPNFRYMHKQGLPSGESLRNVCPSCGSMLASPVLTHRWGLRLQYSGMWRLIVEETSAEVSRTPVASIFTVKIQAAEFSETPGTLVPIYQTSRRHSNLHNHHREESNFNFSVIFERKIQFHVSNKWPEYKFITFGSKIDGVWKQFKCFWGARWRSG